MLFGQNLNTQNFGKFSRNLIKNLRTNQSNNTNSNNFTNFCENEQRLQKEISYPIAGKIYVSFFNITQLPLRQIRFLKNDKKSTSFLLKFWCTEICGVLKFAETSTVRLRLPLSHA